MKASSIGFQNKHCMNPLTVFLGSAIALACLEGCLLPSARAQSTPNLLPQVTPDTSPETYASEIPINQSSDVLLSQADSEGEAAEGEAESTEPSAFDLTPTRDRVRIELGREKPWSTTYGFGTRLGEPSALFGGTRIKTVPANEQRALVFPIAGFVRQGLGPTRSLLLEGLADVEAIATDFTYTTSPDFVPGFFALNLQYQSNKSGSFENGDDNVDLRHGHDAHVNQVGGGFEYFQEVTSDLDIASGLNYRIVSVRPGVFTSNVESEDQFGNEVTVSDDGQDPWLTVNLAGIWNAVDDIDFPSRGTRIRFSFDQSIPIGDASITSTQLAANVSQFIPLFGSEEKPHILILNAQGGKIFEDVAPYAAFSLGGNRTVRGFDVGEIGTGSSFVQFTAEYRIPLVTFKMFGTDINFIGAAFVDYGDVLGTQDDVIGEPGKVRDKDGEGLGYGLGFHFRTVVGLFRLEPAFGDDGDFVLHFTAGDRF